MKKRILSIALCLAMVLTMMPSVAWADDKGVADSIEAGLDIAELAEGDTFKVGEITYTYGGDQSTLGLDLGSSGQMNSVTPTGALTVYKADSDGTADGKVGYILWDSANKTMTLNNAKVTVTRNTTEKYIGALRPPTDAEIVLPAGTNNTITTKSGTGTDGLSGIGCGGNFDISGAGTLTVNVEGTLASAINTGTATSITAGQLSLTSADRSAINLGGTCTLNVPTVTLTTGSSDTGAIQGGTDTKLTIAANSNVTVNCSADTKYAYKFSAIENNGTLTLPEGALGMKVFEDGALPNVTDGITGTGTVVVGETTYISAGGAWKACDAGEDVSDGKVTIDGVTYIKFSGAWVKEGDSVTIGSKPYIYKGDATEAGAGLNFAPGSPWKPLEGNLVWKAGGGYILYSYQAGGSSAAVTLHEAESAKSISLPFSQDAGSDAGSATGCDTTVTLEGISTLSGCLSHEAGSTTFTGSGTLNLTHATTCDLYGPVIIENGARVTLGDGEKYNNSSIKYAYFRQLLTVESGATLTITANTSLFSVASSGVAGIIVENGGTLENNGILQMRNKTAADPGITGAGVVHFGNDNNTSYIKVDNEWLASGGDKGSAGLDLTSAPNDPTVYKAGGGYIVYDPTTNPPNQTLTKAPIKGGIKAKSTTKAMILPATSVKVVFNGTNSITVSNNDAYAFYSDAVTPTTFDLSEGSSTTLDVGSHNAYGIHSKGAVTINGAGATLTINASGSIDYTISAANSAVTLNGGTLAFKGDKGIAAGTITLNGITVTTGTKLSMIGSYSNANVLYGADSTINGELIMPFQRPYTADDFTHFTGSGTIKVGDVTYIKVGSEWLASGGNKSSEALDLTNAPTVKTAYKAGEGGTILWEPTPGDGTAVTSGTLTFTDATINVSDIDSLGSLTAVTLPSLTNGVNVVFKNENNITANANGYATAFECTGRTTFNLKANSKTTLTANGQYAYGIDATDDSTVVTGSGELTVNATGGGMGYAIDGKVEFTGGTIIAKGGNNLNNSAFSTAPTFGDGYKPVVTAGASETDAKPVTDTTEAAVYTDSKYVKITKYVAPSLGGGGGAGGGLIANPADACKDLIKTIGTVTLDKADEIKAAREAFDKLTPAQKQQVDEKALLDAEAALKALEEEAEKKEENKATTARLKDMDLVARSKLVTLKNGKKAIRIVWFEEKNGKMTAITDLDFDGVEIFRSTRRYQGYGKKPIFTTTKGSYLNTAIDEGETYYYKLRAYKIVDGKRVYTDYSLKAKRTIK